MELDLAILRFLKSFTSGTDERLKLLAEEYRLVFARPALFNSQDTRNNPLELIWALEEAIRTGNPNYLSILHRNIGNQA